MGMIFICHNDNDLEFVQRLSKDLYAVGQDVWIDHEHEVPPDVTQDELIIKALNDCDLVILVASSSSLESEKCRQEWSYALAKKIIVVPLMLEEDLTIPPGLEFHTWYFFYTDYESALHKMLRELASLPNIVIASQRVCLVCNTRYSVALNRCPECKRPIMPTRLGELHGLPESILKRYLDVCQAQLMQDKTNLDLLLAVGLIYLSLHTYDIAIRLFDQMVKVDDDHAYAWYALAVAGLRGNRPYLQTQTAAYEAQERCLKAVQHDDTQAHFALLLALIKQDYFQRTGFAVDPPSIQECIDIANRGQKRRSELQALLTLVPAKNSPITGNIEALVTSSVSEEKH